MLLAVVHNHALIGHLGNLMQPTLPQENSTNEQWFEQIRDHFNAINKWTWFQRYWENMEHYKPGGPAFIMIGGEGEGNPKHIKEAQWYNWAEENGAAMFLLEHRYYGQSHPTFDLSTENMIFLSSRQALQDLAHFMTAMNNKHNLTGSWITFGYSYAGSLSAWMSLKFPHLVAGSVASSAPLYSKLDFHEYLQVAAEALETTGSECLLAITEAFTAVEDIIKDKDKWEYLSTIFKLCETLDGSNKMDVASFLHQLTFFSGLIQHNGRHDLDLSSICELMGDGTIGDPIQRLAVVIDFIRGSNETSNLDGILKFGHFLAIVLNLN